MVEHARRGAGLESLYPKKVRKPEYADVDINPEEYTVENFFAHYNIVIMKNESSRWGEDRWNVFLIILRGPYIAGLHVDGSINSLPECFPAYNPWEFKWTETEVVISKLKKDLRTHGRHITLEALRSITDEVEAEEVSGSGKAVGAKGNGMIRNKKTASKSSSKNPSKKRKAPYLSP
ncbi:uncharacterized protein LOC113311151 [Papaver somniferum]|uniref:uncharacterized protein LOC113311151 n=1 Tax=Papaver somniferum TaxID=3469 RepID=UPI000E6FF09D|nr:uncharacterized protein LOC113311151 [Papaver somniferum]